MKNAEATLIGWWAIHYAIVVSTSDFEIGK